MGVRTFFPSGRTRRWTTSFPPYAPAREEVLEAARLDAQACGSTKAVSPGDRTHPAAVPPTSPTLAPLPVSAASAAPAPSVAPIASATLPPLPALPASVSSPVSASLPPLPTATAPATSATSATSVPLPVPPVSPPVSPSALPSDGRAETSGEGAVTNVRRILRGRAPARPNSAAIAVFTAGATVALVTLVAFGTVLDQVWLMPPLVASAALVFGAPTLPLAQPRSVIGGQFLAALTGFAVLALAGSSTWAAAVAGGLALGVTALTRTPHSPAAATATIVVAQHPPMIPFLSVLVAATVILVIVGILVGRSRATSSYPTYWW